MEVNVVKRLLALLIVATIAGGTANGQNQGSRLGKTPANRTVSHATTRPVVTTSSRAPARMVSNHSILGSAPVEAEPYYDSYAGDVVEGDVIYEGGHEYYGPSSPDACGLTCGNPAEFDLCNNGYGFDGRQLCLALPSHGWASVEYLMWYQDGMQTPELVASSPADGILPGATVLYGGNNDILSDRLNGMRVRFGWWFVNNPKLGIEGEYVGTANESETFERFSNGSELLTRPFYNVLTGREDAQLVAKQGVVSGSVRVDAESQFSGAAVRFRRMLCCSTGCGISPLTCGPVPAQSRIDATLGWRYFELDESLQVREALTPLPANGDSFAILDEFRTRNQFNGAEVGVHWQGRRGYWSLDTLMRVGIGNTRQTVRINGSTAITEGGVTSNHTGGLLAQQTNIGTYQKDSFGMIPELGATLGYQLTQNLRFTVGYSLIYWGSVVRPGDQIDRNVNPNLLPPTVSNTTTHLSPKFAFRETDYWIQGLSLGGEYRW